MEKKGESVVISVGGSLICPDKVNTIFLSQLKKTILSAVKHGMRFVLVTGGGAVAREYQKAARNMCALSSDDIDNIGIETTRLNAHLVRTIFEGAAGKEIIINPTAQIIKKNDKHKIHIAAGWKPGCSSDYDAVLIAKKLKAKTIINLSNIDYVCDKDPSQHSDAKPIKSISWKDFRKIVGNKWSPGLNAPFDPVASREAEKNKMQVIIMNGKNPENLRNFLDGKDFIGTRIG